MCFLRILTHSQGEREHLRPKGSFLRTSGKNYTKQLTQIERRETRIRQLSYKHGKQESVSKDLKQRYHIGETEKCPVVLPLFLQRNSGDPAIKVR